MDRHSEAGSSAAESAEERNIDEFVEGGHSLDYIVENFVGIEEIETTIKMLKAEMRKEVKEGLANLEVKVQRAMNETERRLGKKLDETEQKMIDIVRRELRTSAEEEKQKREKMVEAVKDIVEKKKENLKDDVMREMEQCAFFLRRSHSSDTDVEVIEEREGSNTLDSRDETGPVSSSPAAATTKRQPERTPGPGEAKKMKWSEHPRAAHFLELEHEKQQWKKNNAVKLAIFRKGLNEGMWEDTLTWRKRVGNRIDTQYKSKLLMDESRSSRS